MNQNEAFSRVLIDIQLADQGWNTQNTNSVRYEVALEDGTRADYVLCDRHGRGLAVIEAKRFAVNPADAAEQARNYARLLNIPYIFLANGQEIRFWEWRREAYPRPVKTFFKQDDLERRAATTQVRRDPLTIPIDPVLLAAITKRPASTPSAGRSARVAASSWSKWPPAPAKPAPPLP